MLNTDGAMRATTRRARAGKAGACTVLAGLCLAWNCGYRKVKVGLSNMLSVDIINKKSFGSSYPCCSLGSNN
ncbi:conserved hypothetical protein [Ricinus communis]|uniref:Uncharacterized protein n=1 Tax=Ricinus communis TaxID=3988 RepID=B9T065_RICCO|nr:conserved hypothetical protein [Ricinus communis]